MQSVFIWNIKIHPTSILRICCFSMLLCVVASTVHGQQRRRPNTTSPEVAENGNVTFRIQAAKAESVELQGQWSKDTLPLIKNDDGVWEITVNSIPAGVWEYRFRVDDLSMIDPGNTSIKPMRSPRTSILHIPGKPPLAHDFQDVPHGTIHLHIYHSKSLNRLRELAVYTPPNYNAKLDARFPTLYLQHGSGDNHATWTVHGKAHWIADNLIAAKKAKPMVIVMMDGHASPPGAARERRNEFFEKDLLNDVMPFVHSNYRLATDAEQRAIVGLSMGGGQSLTIGLNHTDKFSWIGGFSSAAPQDQVTLNAFADSAKTNDRLNLLWIACGKDDFLLKRNEDFIERLKQANIQHEWILTEGDHSWPIWRKYLADFLPRLFQTNE